MLRVSKLEEQSFERLLAEVGPVKLWATFAPNVETVYTVDKTDAESGYVVLVYESENIHKAVAKFNKIVG